MGVVYFGLFPNTNHSLSFSPCVFHKKHSFCATPSLLLLFPFFFPRLLPLLRSIHQSLSSLAPSSSLLLTPPSFPNNFVSSISWLPILSSSLLSLPPSHSHHATHFLQSFSPANTTPNIFISCLLLHLWHFTGASSLRSFFLSRFIFQWSSVFFGFFFPFSSLFH